VRLIDKTDAGRDLCDGFAGEEQVPRCLDAATQEIGVRRETERVVERADKVCGRSVELGASRGECHPLAESVVEQRTELISQVAAGGQRRCGFDTAREVVAQPLGYEGELGLGSQRVVRRGEGPMESVEARAQRAILDDR
jgi:hypothetical protein